MRELHGYGSNTSSKRKRSLLIGGIDSVELAKTYGTPLFVYDLSLIRERARAFINTFKERMYKLKLLMQVKHFLVLQCIK